MPIIETWVSREGTKLNLEFNDRSWNIYHQGNLEETFGTREDAVAYLREDGFRLSK